MSSFLSHPCHGKCIFEPKDVTNTKTYDIDPECTLKPSERAAKRRRIERYAEIYINGGQLYLQCGGLRGPFNQKWVNPWQEHGIIRGSCSKNDGDIAGGELRTATKKKAATSKSRKVTINKDLPAQKSYRDLESELQKSKTLKGTKPLIAKSKTPFAGDNIRKARTTKSKKDLSKSRMAGREKNNNVSAGKENSLKVSGEDSPMKTKTTKNFDAAKKMLSEQRKLEFENFQKGGPQNEVTDLVVSFPDKPLLAVEKPTEPRQFRFSPSEDYNSEQENVAKLVRPVNKGSESVQVGEDNYSHIPGYKSDKIRSKQFILRPFHVETKSKSTRNMRDYNVYPHNNEVGVSNVHDEIHSEPLRPKNYSEPRLTAGVGSLSSPSLGRCSAKSTKPRYDPSSDAIANNRTLVGRNNPRYMTFDSPGLSPVVAYHGTRSLARVEQPERDFCDNKEAAEQLEVQSLNSQKNSKDSSTSYVQPRTEAKGISQQTEESHFMLEARSCHEILPQSASKGSPNHRQNRSKILEEDAPASDHQRETFVNNQMNMDFSTQNALVAAQNAFQDQLLRKDDSTALNSKKEKTHHTLRIDNIDKSVTPFADFKAKFDGTYLPSQSGPQMSTQELFDMVSPLTFSTVVKPAAKKRASFAASPSKQLGGNEDLVTTSKIGFSPAATDTCKSMQGDRSNANVKSSLKRNVLPATCSMRTGIHESSFSISPDGMLHEVSEYGQQPNSDVEVEAALDDANSFLQSWDIESELKNVSSSNMAGGEKGKHMAPLNRRKQCQQNKL